MSGGFLQTEGLEADWTVSPPGVSTIKALEEGRSEVIQSAPSQAFTTLAKLETPTAIYFAQINEIDGSGAGDKRLRRNVVSPRMVRSTGSVTVTKGLMGVSIPSRNVTNRAAPSVSRAMFSVMSWKT